MPLIADAQHSKKADYVSGYNPKYWYEGGINQKSISTDTSLTAKVDSVSAKGWHAITFWGAEYNGASMTYYFKSQFLEKQSWAVFAGDRLSPVIQAAHKKGLKVMMNLEGVNPYNWADNKWTEENIREVAADIAVTGVDAVFEECFEVKPEVFVSLARALKSRGVEYISGTDPMLLREASFASLWPETSIIDIYNYYFKRDKLYSISTLAQHGSLGYGWAKYWGKPTSLISPINRNWGIANDYTAAIVPYLCMIRSLQFRLDNFIIFGGNAFDPIATDKWIKEYVGKQDKKKPLMNIVVLLDKDPTYPGNKKISSGWNRLFNSGDAITSGALNAGYDIIVSDKVVPADAYWIYAKGGQDDILPKEVVSLFKTAKPVFIQSATTIPSGENISSDWNTVLKSCGVDGTKAFNYNHKDEDILPYTGYYKNTYLRFTGSDIQHGTDLRAGTIIPNSAVSGNIYCLPNKTYGKGPFITGKNNKYVVALTALNWEVAYPISDILSGGGILPSSNVWGVVGKDVTALLAIETTELEMNIPGLPEGSKIHVVIWDKMKNKKTEETITYKSPYKHFLNEYDLILIDAVK